MSKKNRNVATAILLTAVMCLLGVTTAEAREPGWTGEIIALGQQRNQIQSKPIIHRPYRPLHFYGNTVRRRHYRQTVVPLPQDFFQGLRSFLDR